MKCPFFFHEKKNANNRIAHYGDLKTNFTYENIKHSGTTWSKYLECKKKKINPDAIGFGRFRSATN
jgi:hypothetical protein